MGILIDAPYNKDIDINELKEKSNCKKMYRYHSLYEFACSIKKITNVIKLAENGI